MVATSAPSIRCSLMFTITRLFSSFSLARSSSFSFSLILLSSICFCLWTSRNLWDASGIEAMISLAFCLSSLSFLSKLHFVSSTSSNEASLCLLISVTGTFAGITGNMGVPLYITWMKCFVPFPNGSYESANAKSSLSIWTSPSSITVASVTVASVGTSSCSYTITSITVGISS